MKSSLSIVGTTFAAAVLALGASPPNRRITALASSITNVTGTKQNLSLGSCLDQPRFHLIRCQGTPTDPVTGRTYTSQRGAGYLDGWSALNDTTTPIGTALSPTVRYDPVSSNVYLLSDAGAAWGTRVPAWIRTLWGKGAVWGTRSSKGTAVTAAATATSTPAAMDIAIHG